MAPISLDGGIRELTTLARVSASAVGSARLQVAAAPAHTLLAPVARPPGFMGPARVAGAGRRPKGGFRRPKPGPPATVAAVVLAVRTATGVVAGA